MDRAKKYLLPCLVLISTSMPLLFVMAYLLYNGNSVSGSSASYLANALIKSLQYSVMAYIICFSVFLFILYNLFSLPAKMLTYIVIFYILQLQLGVVPKLYGYLGAFSVSGFWGLVSDSSIFSYSAVGVSISLFYIYSPFFFIPVLNEVKNHVTFSRAIVLTNSSSLTTLKLLLRIYRKDILYGSLLFFALTVMDFTCSDLVGGGKYDTYGKALYKTAITFREYLTAFLFGASILVAIVYGVTSLSDESK